MFILEEPYVSDFLIETIKKNNYTVLDNNIAEQYFPSEKLIKIKDIQNLPDDEIIYSNSENSVDWIVTNMPESDTARMIKLSKDKIKFRQMLKTVYPDFYFKGVNFDDLYSIREEELNFPLVLKPCIGFLSFGVYQISNYKEWQSIVNNIKNDIDKYKSIFPNCVVDTSKFIVEEMIDGQEYAIDGYFNENSESVILNIFQHPFVNRKDVSDRLYYTNKNIITENLEDFTLLLNKIGKFGQYKNFPFHLELRKNKNKTIPIEINPLRFCGWCITDIAKNAWGINVYETFMNKMRPNWECILDNSDSSTYYFTIGDIPSDINRQDIKSINYELFLQNIKNPLVIRKIDYTKNPVFAIVFAKTNSDDEMNNLLSLDTKPFVITKG